SLRVKVSLLQQDLPVVRQVQGFRVDGNAQHTSRQRIVARPRVFAIVVLYLTMVSACAAVDEDVLLVRADYRAIETVVENRLGAADFFRNESQTPVALTLPVEFAFHHNALGALATVDGNVADEEQGAVQKRRPLQPGYPVISGRIFFHRSEERRVGKESRS